MSSTSLRQNKNNPSTSLRTKDWMLAGQTKYGCKGKASCFFDLGKPVRGCIPNCRKPKLSHKMQGASSIGVQSPSPWERGWGEVKWKCGNLEYAPVQLKTK
jgi:hypothetical protein